MTSHRALSGIALLLFLFNLSMTLVFFYSRWSPHAWSYSIHRIEKLVVLCYVAVMLSGLAASALKERARLNFLRFNVSQAVAILSLLAVEWALSAFPALLPARLVQLAPELSPSLSRVRQDVVEYLPENPWVKFRPHVLMRGVIETDKDFVSFWTTDRFGFKNDDKLAGRSDIAAIALGDSFVEAWGVPVERTWAAIVSSRGFPVYNLGVQGYAPQQMVGVLKNYGVRFKARFVIFGYTPGFEARTLDFVKPDFFKDGAVAQGIVKYFQEQRAPERRFKVLNAILDLYKGWVVGLPDRLSESVGSRCRHLDLKSSLSSPYCVDVDLATRVTFDSQLLQWKLTSQTILDTKRIAEKMGAGLVVLLFYHRPLIYYERVMNAPAPQTHYELQTAAALKEFCRQNGIEVIDTYPALKAYVANLPEPVDLNRLPYFKTDGHLNVVGQEIVASLILRYFQEKKAHPVMTKHDTL